MSFIEEIIKYKSVSIVGLAKNAGKTECLNYILDNIRDTGKNIAITSIGLDGENRDLVKNTPKPTINLYPEMFFVTSEKHYLEKNLIAEIRNVSDIRTSLGRLVTAKALSKGKAVLSGPADTMSLKRLIADLHTTGIDVTLVDGALSRLSLSSPAVTEAMVLATGAAVSGNISLLVRKTKYIYDLIQLDKVEEETYHKLCGLETGVWAINKTGEVHSLDIPSVLIPDMNKENMFRHGETIFVAGAISDKFLEYLRMQKNVSDILLIVKDFTRIFASMESYYAFLKKGGRVKVLQKSKLIAVSINPQSPDGYCLDSDELKQNLESSLGIPVYDVRKMVNCN